MPANFAGLWPAVITPMDDEGRVSLETLERMIQLYVAQGLDGLYITGSTGQWPLLTLEERQEIAACAMRVTAGRIPVMVHVGATTTNDAVLLACHARSINADAVSTVAPIYYSHSADVVFDFYRAVGAATDLPLFVYHLSIVNTLRLGPAEYVERLLKLPNIAGMKITDIDLYQFGLLHSHSAGRLQLFSGADEVMGHAVLSGACGAIGTFYNLWGPACKKARQAIAAGDVEFGRRFMLRFQTAISRVIRSGSIWSFIRAAMQLEHGIDIGRPRAPLGAMDQPWDPADVREIVRSVNAAAE